MKEARDNFGGSFENPTDGWHVCEIDDGIEFVKDRETKEATSTLLMRFNVVDDSEEEGRSVFQRFDLADERGQQNLAALLYWIKMDKAIEKNFKINDGDQLDEKEWGAKYLCVDEDEKAAKIVDAIIAKAPGKSVMLKTKNRVVQVAKRDNPKEKEDREFCNIIKLARVGDEKATAEMKAQKGGNKEAHKKSSPPPAEASDDTEDWPES